MTIVPLFPEREKAMSKVRRWTDELQEQLKNDEVSALVVRYITTDGECHGFQMLPSKAPTLIYVMLGQLVEAQRHWMMSE